MTPEPGAAVGRCDESGRPPTARRSRRGRGSCRRRWTPRSKLVTAPSRCGRLRRGRRRGDAHARLVAPGGVGREAETRKNPQTGTRRKCAGGSWPSRRWGRTFYTAVVVEVGRDDSQGGASGLGQARLGRDIGEPPAVVAEDVVGLGLQDLGVARRVAGSRRAPAEPRVCGVPGDGGDDVEVEDNQAGECGRGRPAAVFRQAVRLREVVERPSPRGRSSPARCRQPVRVRSGWLSLFRR